MIILIIAATLIPTAVLAAIALEPHMESYVTRKALKRAHRASNGTSNTPTASPEPHATSPTVETETEPHQSRVAGSKSPVDERKLWP